MVRLVCMPIRKILILGAGSAGLMAAVTLKRRLPQLEREWLHQPDRAEDLGHAGQQHRRRGRGHPSRGDGEERRGIDEVDHARKRIEHGQQPADAELDQAPGSHPGAASVKPAKSNPGTTTQETRL